MKIVYIKEIDESLNIKKKIKELLNLIDIEYIDGKVQFILPINNKSKSKKTIKISKKLNKMLEKECIKNVVLSTNLMNNEPLKNILYQNNINILDGRKLFSILAYKSIEKVCECSKLEMQNIEISILVNHIDEIALWNIKEIAKNTKRVNVISNHLEKLKSLQELLYEEFGIMIKISNNKKKDLLKSSIILNIDFPEDLINKYKIPNKCIIININNEININSKLFNGININNYNIIVNNENKLSTFSKEIIYESYIYNLQIREAIKKITNDKVRNIKLYRQKRFN